MRRSKVTMRKLLPPPGKPQVLGDSIKKSIDTDEWTNWYPVLYDREDDRFLSPGNPRYEVLRLQVRESLERRRLHSVTVTTPAIEADRPVSDNYRPTQKSWYRKVFEFVVPYGVTFFFLWGCGQLLVRCQS